MDSTTEASPLLQPRPNKISNGDQEPDADLRYRRYSDSQKRVILALVSLTSLLSFFTMTCYVPMIPAITKELGTTTEMVNISIGVYLISLSFGSIFWAGYAEFYGRRPIYLISLGIYTFGCIAVSLSQNIWQLVFARALQAFGVCSFASIGSGTIVDIYEPARRGLALGIYCGVTVVAPATAPLVGGFVAQYSSWRWMQVGLAVLGVIFEFLIWATLPETSHPGSRGVDNLDPHSRIWDKVAFLNPLRPLTTLLRPNIAITCLILTVVLIPEYVLIVPMPYILERSWGITNSAQIGAVCMAMGAGSAVGAPLSGVISDRVVLKYYKKRGKRVPEDRLRAAWLGLGYIVPISVLVFGIVAEYARTQLGLGIAIACLFSIGVGVDLAFGPGLTYIADCSTERTVETLAANSATRLMLLSIASSGILPIVKAIGNTWTGSIMALLTWFGCILLNSVISRGQY